MTQLNSNYSFKTKNMIVQYISIKKKTYLLRIDILLWQKNFKKRFKHNIFKYKQKIE